MLGGDGRDTVGSFPANVGIESFLLQGLPPREIGHSKPMVHSREALPASEVSKEPPSDLSLCLCL